jgi:hypothetical protein
MEYALWMDKELLNEIRYRRNVWLKTGFRYSMRKNQSFRATVDRICNIRVIGDYLVLVWLTAILFKYFGFVVSKNRITCKLEWLLKEVVEAYYKGGQDTSKYLFCDQIRLMRGLYTDDFPAAWIMKPSMIECFVDLKGCGREWSWLVIMRYMAYKKNDLEQGCINSP